MTLKRARVFLIHWTLAVIAAALAFVLLYRYGLYPPERRVTILDFDWVYRRLGAGLATWLGAAAGAASNVARAGAANTSKILDRRLHAIFSPVGAFARALPAGVLAVWTVLLLGAAIIVAFLGRLHPLGAILAGIMIAITAVGGEMAQIGIKLPFAAVGIFQAMMLFLILASDVLVRYRVRVVRPGEVAA